MIGVEYRILGMLTSLQKNNGDVALASYPVDTN
jgi:hypothetical protein